VNGSISTRTAALLAGVIPAGIALIVTVVLLVAPAAHAAAPSQPVQFSDDGIHWSTSYTGTLFGGVLLVPGASVDRAFYVRNAASDPAVMSVTLYDVATTDIALATAMSVSTSTPGLAGAAVPVTAASPCATLSRGQILAAGGSIRLDNTVALGDLSGTVGQAHNVSFKLAVSLSSTDVGAPAPDTCPTDFGAVVGSPDPGTGTGSHPVYHHGAAGWTPAPPAESTPTPSATPTPPVTPTPPDPGLGTLVGNTERFYQENTVAFWLAMAVIGALLLVLVRRRRSDDDDSSPHHPYSRQPTTQIGTGR